MNKIQFEKGYIKRSKITPEFYQKHFITLPCQCGADICRGWAAIHNTPEMINLHNETRVRQTASSKRLEYG